MNYIFKLIQKLTSNKQLNFQLTFKIKQLTLVNESFLIKLLRFTGNFVLCYARKYINKKLNFLFFQNMSNVSLFRQHN